MSQQDDPFIDAVMQVIAEDETSRLLCLFMGYIEQGVPENEAAERIFMIHGGNDLDYGWEKSVLAAFPLKWYANSQAQGIAQQYRKNPDEIGEKEKSQFIRLLNQ